MTPVSTTINSTTSLQAALKASTRAPDGDYKTKGNGHMVKDSDGDYKANTPAASAGAAGRTASATLAALNMLNVG